MNIKKINNKSSININTRDSENFGDGVNKVFWEYITQNKIYGNASEFHYITTGSIMCCVNNKSIIFGTGFISNNGDIGGDNFLSKSSIKHQTPYKIIAVRGPLSRQKMLDFNIECPENYGDPLMLMPCLNNSYTNIEDNIIGIIPHYIDKNNKNYTLLKTNLEKKGYNVKYIDIEVGANQKKLIDTINKCKYIISSSLHGVIMGIVYKKKTIFVEFSDKVIGNGFKFEDFFKSIGITYKNINTYDIGILDNIINVNYEYLIKTGIKLISLIPFISSERKIELTIKYKNFYNDM
jgi:pyruvyltransferase